MSWWKRSDKPEYVIPLAKRAELARLPGDLRNTIKTNKDSTLQWNGNRGDVK